ncbi:MAG: hypothetical protein JXB17_13780, partial [Bacteroidales bacterium]|nr:hypothetical protein [Bacteroidales bacterium]
MRKSLIIIILTIPLLLNGQNKFYDYHELDTSIIKLYADSLGKELYEFTKKFKLDYYQKSFVGIDSVPIKLHFILKADSTGQNATIEEIENEIAIVNNYFQNSNIHFFIFPDINYIYDDSLYDFEHDHDEDSLLTNYYFPFAINLYVVNTIYAVGHQVGGTGHGLGGTYDYVMMI